MDVRLLVRWLGIEGAKAGILQSKNFTIDVLREVAQGLGIEVGSKSKRSELVDEIVAVASRRIDKSLDELFQMSQDDVVKYFDEIQVERKELLDLLKKMELDPGREGRRNLVEFVARELAETGRFLRIATDKPRQQ